MKNNFIFGQYVGDQSAKDYLEKLFLLPVEMKEKLFDGLLRYLYQYENPVLLFKLGTPLHEIEKEVLIRTLRFCKCNRSKTARYLGVNMRTIYNKIIYYDLQDFINDLEKEFGIVKRLYFAKFDKTVI